MINRNRVCDVQQIFLLIYIYIYADSILYFACMYTSGVHMYIYNFYGNAEVTLDELETETRASTNPNISDDDGTDDDVDEAAFEEVIVAPVLIPPRAIRGRRGGEVVRGRVRGGSRGRGRPIVIVRGGRTGGRGRGRRVFSESIEVQVPLAEIIEAPVPTAVVQLRRGRSSKRL